MSQHKSAGSRVLDELRKNPVAGERAIYAARKALEGTGGDTLPLQAALRDLWSELRSAAPVDF